MTDSKHSRRALSILVFLPTMLVAQRAAENSVPLKTWTNPLYWQPNQAEKTATAKIAPSLQFPGNAVSADALSFVAITPCRLMDTRGGAFNGTGTFAPGQIASGATLTIDVQATTGLPTEPAPCGIIPAIAEAYSFNITVVPHAAGAVDYITVWPDGSSKPFVATLNDPQGANAANAAIIAAGTPTGAIQIYNSGPSATDVVIDMNGYFTAPTDGSSNTAVGIGTLESLTGGYNNTATGASALLSDSTGNNNTASGAYALATNLGGNQNTASGSGAMEDNTGGSQNTASGYQALQGNTSGGQNTANGVQALVANTVGGQNTASGVAALISNVSGSRNTAIGDSALASNLAGTNNTGLGYQAGISIVGSNNIDIGNPGTAADGTEDNGEIRIGANQSNTYIAGIYNGTPNAETNVPVCIDTTGLLGTNGCGIDVDTLQGPKVKIADMGDSSGRLFQLRPVTFFSKLQYEAGLRTPQYGLLPEDVAGVYPEMVGYDKTGRPSSVKYQSLAPMLLNELQKQNLQILKLQERLLALEELLSDQTPALSVRSLTGQ